MSVKESLFVYVCVCVYVESLGYARSVNDSLTAVDEA